MCPACFATISMIVAGAISTAGVTALAARTLSRRRDAVETAERAAVGADREFPSPEEKENQA